MIEYVSTSLVGEVDNIFINQIWEERKMAKKRSRKCDPKYRSKQKSGKRRRQKARQEKRRLLYQGTGNIYQRVNFSFPDEGDEELCMARVDSGQICWCAEICECRVCQEGHRAAGLEPCTQVLEHECPEACRACPNYKPCWK